MIKLFFLNGEAFEAASNVNNFWAMTCFLIAGISIIIGGLSGKTGDNTKLFVASGLALAMCIIGALVHVNTSGKLEEEYKKLEKELNELKKDNDSLKGISGELKVNKLCCENQKLELKEARDTITNLKLKINDCEAERRRASEENSGHKANDARPYGFVQGYAVVKNKEGKWGYLHRGHFISKVDFDYIEACRFYDGLAGVRCSNKKYGFINRELDLIIECKYDKIWGFQKDSAKVELNGVRFWISRTGEKLSTIKK